MGSHQQKVKVVPPGLALLALTGVLWFPVSVYADENAPYPIAGMNPDQRPQNAPVMLQGPLKDKSWYENALHGVEAPYPASLRFLEDQGGWYTPFTRSGMTGPYDLRGWYSK